MGHRTKLTAIVAERPCRKGLFWKELRLWLAYFSRAAWRFASRNKALLMFDEEQVAPTEVHFPFVN
jgi:hypothetical protein